MEEKEEILKRVMIYEGKEIIIQETDKQYYLKLLDYFKKLIDEDSVIYYVDREDYTGQTPLDERKEDVCWIESEGSYNGIHISKLASCFGITLNLGKGYKKEDKIKYLMEILPGRFLAYITKEEAEKMYAEYKSKKAPARNLKQRKRNKARKERRAREVEEAFLREKLMADDYYYQNNYTKGRRGKKRK